MKINQIYLSAGLSSSETQKMTEYMDWNDEFYNSSAYDKLYEYFTAVTEEMPYGTAKARDGDPDLWILNYLEAIV